MKLNIAVVLLTFGLVATSSAGQARSTIDKIHMRVTVQDVVLLTDFSGKVIPVDCDPRFAVTVRIESVGPAVTNFTVGAVVAFAIHSPSLLFGEEAKKGKTCDFSVQREIKHGKTRYFGLKVEKVQTAPVASSARVAFWEISNRGHLSDSERFISTCNNLREHGRHPKSLQDSLRHRYCVPRFSGNPAKLIDWFRGPVTIRIC